MLTKRQNLLETIRGGNPDRFVKQHEFLNMIHEAALQTVGYPMGPGQEGIDPWGITWIFKEGQLGAFPLHDAEHKVLNDITQWRKYVKKPDIPTSDKIWAPAIAHAHAVDRNEQFVTAMSVPGIFDMTHDLMGMENALMAFYEEPEAMHDLLDYITEYHLEFAQAVIEKFHPDALFQHDDWGSNKNSFLSPDMFNEFIVPCYKKLYGFYKANGVELIVHHSDSYAANLVPSMIAVGIDIYQGVMTSNNIPELIKKYGEKISFMGGINSGEVDFPGWTKQIIAGTVEKACRDNGKSYFIPCVTHAGPVSHFPGVYDAINMEIDKMSKEMF